MLFNVILVPIALIQTYKGKDKAFLEALKRKQKFERYICLLKAFFNISFCLVMNKYTNNLRKTQHTLIRFPPQFPLFHLILTLMAQG